MEFDKIKSKSKKHFHWYLSFVKTHHQSNLGQQFFCVFEKWEGIEAFKYLMDEDIDYRTFIKDWIASQKIVEKVYCRSSYERAKKYNLKNPDFFYLIR